MGLGWCWVKLSYRTVLGTAIVSLGGTPGCTPGSPNPDHISDQKMSFSAPVFRPGL